MYIPGQSYNPYGAPPIMAENTPLPETVPFPTTAPSAPPIMGMRAPQVMPAQQIPAPAPVPAPAPTPTPTPAPVYDPVADMFVRGANKYVLDEKGNVVQVPQDTGFIPDTPGGMVSTLDPNLRNKAVSAGLSPENIAALAGDMRVPPSYTPPTAPTPLSAFRNPSENAALDWMSLDDQLGYFFSTNAANPADVKGNRSAFVPLDENAGYRLYDARTGQYVAEGVGAQGLQDVYSTAQNLSATGGTNADWRVEMRKPGSESWSTMARDKPKGDVLGTVADIALPAIGAALAGPLGIAAPIAAAAGSGLSSVAQGRSLKNTLLRAGLTAGATAAGGSLLGEAAGGAGESVTGGLLDTGGILPTVGGGFSATLGGAAGSSVGGALGSVGTPIIVTGTKAAAPSVAGSLLGGATGSGLGSLATNVTSTSPTQPPSAPEGNVIEVVGNRVDPTSFAERAVEPFASSVANALGPDVTIPTTQGDPIIVEGARLEPMPGAEERITNATIASTLAGAIPTSGILQSGQTPTDGTTTMETDGGLLSDIDLSKLGLSDWLNIAGLGIGTIGDLVGGGGGGGLSTIPAGLFSGTGGGSGAFSSTLPAATMPGLTAAPGGTYARQDLSDVDWATYGERPELSMFSYVPRPGEGPLASAADAQNSIQPSPNAPPIMNEDDGAMARGGLVGYAAGGGVNGPGDGREDVIPAMLSDGEYVIDAETVALLGNGSSKAGADALDRFRVNLRKHKGKQLARGGFSSNAKSPMHYLDGAAG